jgi:hypothetical protein
MDAKVWKLLIAGLMVAGMACAQDEEAPDRGVARLSLINGDVSVRRGDSGDLVAAALNAPLVVEDSVITAPNARAELQFDWANMIRLSGGTEVRLAQLDTNRYVVELARGLVTFRVEHESDADAEISTPCVSVRPLRVGSYRVAVQDNGDCEITVRSGEADIFTPQGSERLRPGRTMLARGPAASPEFQMLSELPRDGWDRWNEDRDRYFDRTDAYRYVDQSVYGAEDLGNYGSWVNVPPYGWVWSPRVDAAWAPYYNGDWGWLDYYGWSWISYDPWGWAPFHYGRWFWGGNHGWCWYPGGLHRRHFWSPGLVAFVGWGTGGVGVGFGHVGWIPLAPYETYYPWYGRGFYRGYRNGAYIDNSVHMITNVNIYNTYRNARVNNGVIAVDGSQFGRFAGNHVRMNGNDLRDAGVVRGQLPMVPDRSSLRFSDRATVAAPALRTPANERFVTRRPLQQVERVPFDQQRNSMEQAARRTFGGPAGGRPPEAMTGSRPAATQAPAARAEVPAGGQGNVVRLPSPADSGNANWRRFGGANEGAGMRPSKRPAVQPGANHGMRNAPAEPSAAGPSDNGGWRRFEPNRESVPARPATPASPRSVERPAPSRQVESPRQDPPAREQYQSSPMSAPEPRVESPRAAPRSEPIRISPPIVRERPAPSMQTPRPSPPSGGTMRAPSGGGGGGDRAAAPRSSGGAHSGGGGGRTRNR